MSRDLPSLVEAKAMARQLRAELAGGMGHAQALERVAHQFGFSDWNGMHAAIAHRAPARWVVGGRLRGRYLSQPFEATVVSVVQARPGWFWLELDLDEAVDVVTFESFSNFRKRVRGLVGPAGRTREQTSDGEPHLVVEM